MLYSLSTQVIADTVHALVALELLSASEPTRTALSPLLSPERRGMLTLMIKNAFSETVLDLIPYVDDADLDGEKPAVSPGEPGRRFCRPSDADRSAGACDSGRGASVRNPRADKASAGNDGSQPRHPHRPARRRRSIGL